MPMEIVIEQVLTSIITGVVILGLAFSPIGKALAHRLIHGKAPRALPVSDDPRVDELSSEVAALREHLDNTLDRLDFTERMLSQAREKGQLGPGNGK